MSIPASRRKPRSTAASLAKRSYRLCPAFRCFLIDDLRLFGHGVMMHRRIDRLPVVRVGLLGGWRRSWSRGRGVYHRSRGRSWSRSRGRSRRRHAGSRSAYHRSRRRGRRHHTKGRDARYRSRCRRGRVYGLRRGSRRLSAARQLTRRDLRRRFGLGLAAASTGDAEQQEHKEQRQNDPDHPFLFHFCSPLSRMRRNA